MSDRDASRCYCTGWKCLDGGALTFDKGDAFATLRAARVHAKHADYEPGMGRRVFMVDASGGVWKSWRVRLGPDYLPRGRRTGWGMW